MRAIEQPLRLECISVASYRDQTSPCAKPQVYLPDLDVKGAHVLLVDDIIDTGTTLAKVVATLKASACASLRTCVLLDKPSRRKTSIQPDFFGFEIPDALVVGYGLDFAERYRNLLHVAVLERP